MKFTVQYEETVRVERHIEAESYEEAAAKAFATRPTAAEAPPVPMLPVWISTEAHVLEHGELEYQILGTCSECKAGIVDRRIPGQPFTHGIDPNNDYRTLCYGCYPKDKPTP